MAKQRLNNRYEAAKSKDYAGYVSDRLDKENLTDVMSGIVDRKLGLPKEADDLVQAKLKELDDNKAKDDARFDDLQEAEAINGMLEPSEQEKN
jgi:hypothetical protein